MKFRNGIIALGFLTFFIQFLGFPQSWKDVLYVLIGLALMTLGYVGGKKREVSLVEN
ncbi:MAG TPA: hypothetical protein VIR98_01725 [Candidatus Paceibacterota bacterium]|jgi:hypothetical protein